MLPGPGEINGGVDEEKGFDGAFPRETESPDLKELRNTFRRKSFVARQEKLCRALLAEGRSPSSLRGCGSGSCRPQRGLRSI